MSNDHLFIFFVVIIVVLTVISTVYYERIDRWAEYRREDRELARIERQAQEEVARAVWEEYE